MAGIDLDSLKNKLNKTRSDSSSIIAQLKSMERFGSDQHKALIIAGKWAIKQATRLKSDYLLMVANQFTGNVYLRSEMFVEASIHLTEALKISEKNNLIAQQIDILRLLGSIYSSNKQEPKAIEYLKRCIKLCKTHNMESMLGKTYFQLASINANLAKKYDRKNDTAVYYSKLGLPLILKQKDTASIIKAYALLAQNFSYNGMHDSSIHYLNQADELIKSARHDDLRMTHLFFKASVLYDQKKYRETIKVFEITLPLTKKFNSPSLQRMCYKNMAFAYEELKDYVNAFKYSQLYINLHDSIVSTENFAKAADIQNKYEREKKEKEILKLNNEKQIDRLQLNAANQKRRQVTMFLVYAIIVLLVMVVLAILLFKNVQERKRAYIQLQEKSDEIHKQTLQLAKQERLIAQFQSQMNPHFVFNALHNIQGLVITNEEKKATQQIQSLAQLMRKTFSNAEKEEITIEEEVAYLNKYMEFEMAARANKINFQINLGKDVENIQIPPMMIQPFVENAIKHAELDKVSNPFIKVNFDIQDDLLRVQIEDNGTGIKKHSDLGKISHSMSVIKSRLELLFPDKKSISHKKIFNIKTIPETESGTTVVFYLPLVYSF